MIKTKSLVIILTLLFICCWELNAQLINDTSLTQDITMINNPTQTLMPKWRVSADLGAAYFIEPIAGISGDINTDHAQRLRIGYTYGAKASYYFNNDSDLGLGLIIRNTHTSHETSTAITETDGSVRVGSLIDNINVLFVAPMITAKPYFRDNRNNASINLAPFAFVSYTNNAMLIERYILKQRTKGVKSRGFIVEIEYFRAITTALSFGGCLSFNVYNINDYTKIYSDGRKEIVSLSEGDGLTHISLTAGFQYSF